MNFYGSVGYIMAGSGIQSLLELIYAEHTVPHIFFAKAFTRATRAPVNSSSSFKLATLQKAF